MDERTPEARPQRRWQRMIPVFVIMAVLLSVPWWMLLAAGNHVPVPVLVVGSLAFVAVFLGLPARHRLGCAA